MHVLCLLFGINGITHIFCLAVMIRYEWIATVLRLSNNLHDYKDTHKKNI